VPGFSALIRVFGAQTLAGYGRIGELTAAGAYNGLEQKSGTAWLDLRNKAAHGHYDDYDHQQVAALIRDVREFLIRNPA
jgi:hypothetical protein